MPHRHSVQGLRGSAEPKSMHGGVYDFWNEEEVLLLQNLVPIQDGGQKLYKVGQDMHLRL